MDRDVQNTMDGVAGVVEDVSALEFAGASVPPPHLHVPSTHDDDSDTDVEIERPPSTTGPGVARNGPTSDSVQGHVSRQVCGGGKQGFASVTDTVVVESASALDGRVMGTDTMRQLLGRMSGVVTRYVSRIDPTIFDHRLNIFLVESNLVCVVFFFFPALCKG
jgi:hypothetical protein